MTFPRESAFAQETKLQEEHRERVRFRAKWDEKIENTMQAMRIANPKADPVRMREILSEMAHEASMPNPDEERIEALEREGHELLESDTL